MNTNEAINDAKSANVATPGDADTRVVAQPSLPFDADGGGDADAPIAFTLTSRARRTVAPIPFELTARARRTVAPGDLPDLRVVDPSGPTAPGVSAPQDARSDGDLDDPRDTRPARARALRRAGTSLADIAAELEVDDLLVRAWVGDVPAPSATLQTQRRRRRATSDPVSPTTSGTAAPPTGSQAGRRRAAACEQARLRLAADPAFAAGLGLLAGLAEIDPHAVTLTTTRPEVLAAARRWLDEHLPTDVGRVRLVLRLGGGVAGDLARHRWAQRIGLDAGAVASTRWHAAPAPDAVQGLLRIADPVVAATLAGWCDALLAVTSGQLEDLAF